MNNVTYPDTQVIVEFNNGTSIIAIDDNCYVIYNLNNNQWRMSSWIFPEALEILKTLPNNPSDYSGPFI